MQKRVPVTPDRMDSLTLSDVPKIDLLDILG